MDESVSVSAIFPGLSPAHSHSIVASPLLTMSSTRQISPNSLIENVVPPRPRYGKTTTFPGIGPANSQTVCDDMGMGTLREDGNIEVGNVDTSCQEAKSDYVQTRLPDNIETVELDGVTDSDCKLTNKLSQVLTDKSTLQTVTCDVRANVSDLGNIS